MPRCPAAASTPCVWDAGGFHTHFQCVSLCGRRNASLPCVRSAEEAAAIAAAAVGTEWAWVGLYQLTEDRHGIDQGWERVAQCTGVDNHTTWAGDQPDDLGMQDCAALAPTGALYDVTCRGWHRCLCEAGLLQSDVHAAWAETHEAAQGGRALVFSLALLGLLAMPTIVLSLLLLWRRLRERREAVAAAAAAARSGPGAVAAGTAEQEASKEASKAAPARATTPPAGRSSSTA